jgi:acetylornithine/succinyldiaminopimelate/putrescine aminotransferase
VQTAIQTTVEAAEEYIKTLRKIENMFTSKKSEDTSGKLENAVNTLRIYLGGATTELQKVKDFETNLMNTPEAEEKLTFENQWSGKTPTTISPSVQQALNELLGTKLNTDGTLGPQTATALQMYKDQYNNMKHIFDPSLHQDILQKAKHKKMGIMGETPF